ncbi:MAG: hypothetical protein ACREEB_07585 [Caulobacteraceae bacterium]
MNRFSLVICLVTAVVLGSCASTDHSAALSLGNAGVTATQALSEQTSSMGQTVSELSPWWGVRNALACAAVIAELRSGCLAGATAAPNPALADRVSQISAVITKRKIALDTLNQAYAAFVDLAKYNGGHEASAALATSFGKVNSYVTAASALVPGGQAAPVISTTIGDIADRAVAFAADSKQNRQIIAASKDLRVADDAMFKGLMLERDATASLLVTLQGERAALDASALAAGLIAPADVLGPIINQAYPGMKVASPPAANGDVIMAAAKNALADQAQTATASAPKSYDDALAVLRDLSAQHQKLETKQPLDLTQIDSGISNLQADMTQMSPASPAPKTAATQ